ncbi:hypothetical protein SOVF_040870 [Spinacia oleracea]|nr:hypothetical protein SOVF_040870 [Spinacia oleracea]
MVMVSSELTSNNILLFQEGGSLKCQKAGSLCQWMPNCCKGLACTRFPHGEYCTWCPSAGDSCGMRDPCCPGLTCDGDFWGTCY